MKQATNTVKTGDTLGIGVEKCRREQIGKNRTKD